ncbi:ABR022Cp [Eremothecium gossypii ATCC 10895]|uniref:ABR022Cp n=1 Tax=Eremothecium gossypii (strain ATCC 10895 / CBS 109.51 / FGSC 9923 / NRRL Y-1056) TaxID=284811 RepID=Q75DS7_EREGS|nr:ABR022Cp [Eremothecium gossypii ATCC 10895]AAS50792.4 ABR022Cp [Eremothecium gossypii ATCC 10895]AEY95081.1 FABR022Cp [Eremothecium gossypii FDAG1]
MAASLENGAKETTPAISNSGSQGLLAQDGGSDRELDFYYNSDGELIKLVADDEKPEEDLGNLVSVAEHACSYCSIDSPSCVVKCNACNKWFCNSKNGTSSSHIINHLVFSHHNVVSLHPESDLGDTVLECYNCGCRNVFLLGFVSAKSEAVVVILCRLPCAQTRNVNWDTDQWQSLIENRQLLSWVAEEPSEEDQLKACLITPSQISKLEMKWRSNKDATINDIDLPEEQEELPPVLMRYTDAYQYQRSFGPLVKLEADYDKQLKESQALEHISVTWTLGLNNRHLASFALSTFESNELKVAVGDEMILRYSGLQQAEWEGRGYILRLPNSFQDEFTLELKPSKAPPPTNLTTGFTAEFVWKGTSYQRMQEALKKFAVDKKSISGYLYYKILGHDVPDIEFEVDLPKDFSIPNFTKLNTSQVNAVAHVLQRPLSLIQGPPGTGKTVTSATIVYHLSKMHKERVLVCAPSNVAVDHLAAKLRDMGLKVVRLTAKSREDVESSVSDLALHNLVARSSRGELKKLLKLKDEVGELSVKDTRSFVKLVRKTESTILKKADVVCCTCVGAGDKRLDSKFRTVLIDESTQASEPECLIPIIKGAKQVVLVGDHQQLGPVILDRNAGDAGLKQSLFERLISLGHVPIRLEVQYRMNPYLSEFPSNMFYEGTLQNGVTVEQRTVVDSSFPWPICDIPMMFWANYGREEISANGTSYLNRIEAINCERIITRLFKDGVKPEQIGVVTPYEGQRAYIIQYMQMNGSMDKDLYMTVEVASVDAFQGREKDYIILSCVRANDQQSIGFLTDPRRLNVALTRAKYGLAILGNPASLCRNSIWNHLLIHFREKGCLVEGTMDNLQLCTMQLTRSKNVNSNSDSRQKNTKWHLESNLPLPEFPISNNREFDSQNLMSFGGQGSNIFAPSSDLSSFMNSNQQYWNAPGPELGLPAKERDSEQRGYTSSNVGLDATLARELQQFTASSLGYEANQDSTGTAQFKALNSFQNLNIHG